MQKAVRRGDAKLAGYWALELWASGYGQYVWWRLLTVSAEDCLGILTAEVKALHDSYTEINRNTVARTPKGRIRDASDRILDAPTTQTSSGGMTSTIYRDALGCPAAGQDAARGLGSARS